jgi:hypothetical protein
VPEAAADGICCTSAARCCRVVRCCHEVLAAWRNGREVQRATAVTLKGLHGKQNIHMNVMPTCCYQPRHGSHTPTLDTAACCILVQCDTCYVNTRAIYYITQAPDLAAL